MTRKQWIGAGIGLLAIAAGGGFYWRTQHGNRDKNLETRRVEAKLGDVVETVDATGDVVPLNRVEVKPPVSGRLESIIVNEGDQVRAGQTLAWMSSTERAAILDAATSQGPEERKRWEESYKPAPILSPISGLVILNNVVPGQTVDASTVLFALSDKLIVLARVDEVDISRVKLGMRALMTLDAYPNQRISGRVLSILYEGQNVSNVITYGVKILPEKVPPFFRSQMTANVSLIVNQKQNVVLIPIQAVQARPDGEKYVLLDSPGGKPVQQEVQTGVENGTQVEIVSGLAAGDSVLIRSARYRPQNATSSSSPLMMGPPRGGSSRGGR